VAAVKEPEIGVGVFMEETLIDVLDVVFIDVQDDVLDDVLDAVPDDVLTDNLKDVFKELTSLVEVVWV
jgi:uncharacterized UPF0146 family protein